MPLDHEDFAELAELTQEPASVEPEIQLSATAGVSTTDAVEAPADGGERPPDDLVQPSEFEQRILDLMPPQGSHASIGRIGLELYGHSRIPDDDYQRLVEAMQSLSARGLLDNLPGGKFRIPRSGEKTSLDKMINTAFQGQRDKTRKPDSRNPRF